MRLTGSQAGARQSRAWSLRLRLDAPFRGIRGEIAKMEDWSKRTDDEVFSKVGEQGESQAAYWRDIEIKRRVYLLQKDLLNAQVDAVATQKAATIEAVRQSTFMLYSTIGVFLTALVTLATAYFHR